MGPSSRLGKLLSKVSISDSTAKPRETGIFCERCRSIVRELGGANSFEASLSFSHYDTLDQFKIAAESGCWFCSGLWDKFSAEEKETLLSPETAHNALSSGTYAVIEIRPDNGLNYFIGFSASYPSEPFDDFSRRDYQRYSVQPKATSLSDTSSISSSISPHTSSTRSIETTTLIEKWIHKCESSHKHCSAPQGTDDPWYPTRLLDVSNKGNTVSLIETSNKRLTGNYITLSHRWPDKQPCRTLTTNYSSMLSAVAVKTLPCAFRDAVLICKRVRVRYLWIDSLCIVQDDQNDWLRESSLMYKVYALSYLNISAVAAADSSKTLFAHRDLDYFKERTIWTPLNGLEVGPEWREYRIVNEKLYEDEVAHANLNLRGWVTQERLLAPRVVHFGRQEVFWECREITASETYRNGLPLGGLSGMFPRFKNLDPDIYRREKETIGDPDIGDYQKEVMPYKVWNSIVIKYSGTSLTKGQDKLIAIAGIARYMGDMYLNDSYIAGMWERYLDSELLWHATRPTHRPKQYRAPSFSWASIDGEVKPADLLELDTLIGVHGWELQYATDNVYGLVTGGSLTLKCQLNPLTISRRSPKYYHFDLHINGGPATDFLVDLDEELQYFDPCSDRDTLFCTPCKLTKLFGHVTVLLLELVDESTATYRRFGIATAIEPEAISAIANPGDAIRSVPAIRCENGMQVIRLI